MKLINNKRKKKNQEKERKFHTHKLFIIHTPKNWGEREEKTSNKPMHVIIFLFLMLYDKPNIFSSGREPVHNGQH